jgi:hypothetical protein
VPQWVDPQDLDHGDVDRAPQAGREDGARSPYHAPVLRSHGVLLDVTAQQSGMPGQAIVLVMGAP